MFGILGGVASGKSVVASRLHELGAAVLDADVVAHELLNEPEIQAAVGKRFGKNVFDDSGVSRSALARIVVADDDNGGGALADLEAIVHPRNGQRLQEQMRQIESQEGMKALVLDAPVMMKAGWHKFCPSTGRPWPSLTGCG